MNVEHHHEDSDTRALATRTPPDLAWDKFRRRFDVPRDKAVFWRVSRKQHRGRPELVFGPQGPLHIDLEADFDTLREAVGNRPGWYVLHATDENGMLLPEIPTAHVQLTAEESPAEIDPMQNAACRAIEQLTTTLQNLVSCSVQRENVLTQALVTITDRSAQGLATLQQSTAALLGAATNGFDIASGVSLPKTPPPPSVVPAPAAVPPPTGKSFVEFLCSPAGNTAMQAVGGVLKAAIDR